MTGWLITNGFLKGEKFDGIYNLLVEACEKRGVELLRFTNSDILVKIGFNKAVEADFVLFWDKDVKLAAYLEKCGYKVFNSARAIAICDDKALTSLALLNKGIAMPKTIFAPMTFSNVGYTDYNFLKS
ncbi:MAG: RimK family alpha-L-glutamate ligase, partial [Clostridia bacterium]